MADFDGIITPTPTMSDVPLLSKSAIALGGTGGAMNAQAIALANRTAFLNILFFGVVSLADPAFAGGAKGDGIQNDTAAIQAALNSGAKFINGHGKTYLITSLILPADVWFGGEGGSLVTAGAANLITTGGARSTLSGWTLRSNQDGVRKGRYAFEIAHDDTSIENCKAIDITYTGFFNNASGTRGTRMFTRNCGWDGISNYTNAKNSIFYDLTGIRNGRSLISTDAGAQGIHLDGFLSVDNGLDSVPTEHKDVLHFEYATDCTYRNGVIRYTAAYTGGTINQTWAMMRWNASINCHIENVEFDIKSTANGRLQLGQIDPAGVNNADKNIGCSAKNISVNSTAIPGFNLVLLNLDGSARFRLIGLYTKGYVTIDVNTALGNAFESIADVDCAGPGTGTFVTSRYVTNDWTIHRGKLRGYTTAFFLSGYQFSSIRNWEIEGTNFGAFNLVASTAGADYQTDGGVIQDIVLRGNIGTILQTNGQKTLPLCLRNLTLDGNATKGLDMTGGSGGTTTANVKCFGNLVSGVVTTLQSGGTNTAGVINANLNNVAA